MKQQSDKEKEYSLITEAWQKAGHDLDLCEDLAADLHQKGIRSQSPVLLAEAALLRCYQLGESGNFSGALQQLDTLQAAYTKLPLDTSLRISIYRSRLLAQQGQQEEAGLLFAEIEHQLDGAADDVRLFYYEVAEDYYEYHNLPKAFDCIVKGSAIAEQKGDFVRLGYFRFTQGILYYKNNEKEQSLEQLARLLPFLEQHGLVHTQLDTLYYLAQIYANEKQFAESLKCARQGLELASKKGSALSTSKAYLAVIDAGIELGQYAEALEMGYKALEHAQSLGLASQLPHLHQQIARACARSGRTDEAEQMYLQAYEEFKQKGNKHYLRLITKNLAEFYEAQGLFQKALEYHKQCVVYKEELMNESTQRSLAALRVRYEAGKKEMELRELKIKQQQAELERTESELKAIKAQMNPHFIFNALNSIQEMFLIGDKRLANEHLGKFSQLTREILKASCQTSISLTEEINMLHNYLQLEALRFDHGFTYAISFDKQEKADDIHLPPMLLQPYVENAIRHGLLHKKGEKHLRISFKLLDGEQKLLCEIRDNGIGRMQASLLSSNNRPLHQSFSSAANERRLHLLNQNRDTEIGVVYNDLAEGTRVLITIPVRL